MHSSDTVILKSIQASKLSSTREYIKDDSKDLTT